MSDAQKIMQYDARKKSVGVAIVCCLFVGTLGVHRFYLGRTSTAIAMLVLSLASPLLLFLPLLVTATWALVDLFLIPGIARQYNAELASSLEVGDAQG